MPFHASVVFFQHGKKITLRPGFQYRFKTQKRMAKFKPGKASRKMQGSLFIHLSWSYFIPLPIQNMGASVV